MEFSPMNTAELMDRVMDLYKKSFWKQIAYAAILGVVAFVALFALSFVLALVFILFTNFGDSPDAILLMVLLLALPLILMWQAFSGAGHILLSRQAFYGHKVRLKGMRLRKVVPRVTSALIAQILLLIPYFIICFVVLYLIIEFGNASFLDPIAYTLAVGRFLVVFLILGFGYLVYYNVFALSIPVAVFERRSFFGTIRRSWELTKPNFWKLFGTRLIWYIVIGAFYGSIQGLAVLFELASGLFGGTFHVGAGYETLIGSLLMILSYLAMFLVMPLDGILQALIYFNQRMKHEGLDMEIRIEKLSVSKHVL